MCHHLGTGKSRTAARNLKSQLSHDVSVCVTTELCRNAAWPVECGGPIERLKCRGWPCIPPGLALAGGLEAGPISQHASASSAKRALGACGRQSQGSPGDCAWIKSGSSASECKDPFPVVEQSHYVSRNALFPSPALGSSYVYACPPLHPSSESPHAPHQQREGGTDSGMRWVGGLELARPPLDFPSLSEKTPPNYCITGDLGYGSGGGAHRSSRLPPLPPSCTACLGLEL